MRAFTRIAFLGLVLLVASCFLVSALLAEGWIYKRFAPNEESFAKFKKGEMTVEKFATQTVRIADGPMPILARDPKSGDLLCYIMGGEIYKSADGGKSWSQASTPPSVLNPAFGILKSGTWLLGGSFPTTGDDRMTRFRIYRSTDNGKTWDEGRDVDTRNLMLPNGRRTDSDFWGPNKGFGGKSPRNLLAAYGRIIELADGTIALPFYIEGNSEGELTYSLIGRSRDDGQSWRDISVISVDFNEVGFIQQPGGELLAVERGQTVYNGIKGWEHLNLHCLTGLARSVDNGYTWSRAVVIAGDWRCDEHASDIVRLSDGTLLIPTIRRMPQFVGGGVPVAVSYDNGVTWSKDYRIAVRTEGNGWFPTSVVLDDDTIVTVDGHPLGGGVWATRWKLPKSMKDYCKQD
jgi:hypothetical protein